MGNFILFERMATAVGEIPSKPRSCARQRHRSKAEAESVEDWYRINVAVPFLDHINQRVSISVLHPTSNSIKTPWIGSCCIVQTRN